MDALELKNVSLVGISMGRGIALDFTLQAPWRGDQLVWVF